MTLVLHDTMARAKRPFVPVNAQRVTMYVCGPTVYNFAHIGNARPVVVFDVLFRLLRHLYGAEHVVYAANVTDVDDRINQKAIAEGVPIGTITGRYLDAYNADMGILGALTPSFQPRATETMDGIVAMIGRLVEAGAAYAAEGHVLFDIQTYGAYGKLSGRPLDETIAGARVEVAPYKRHPADFVLWKPSKPGEPVWESPFGPGRPGWHIECSAMIEQVLGLPIDIHGGGADLIFPHHENELAQGMCADDVAAYANYWLHNGFLNMDAEKMSKSLGNVELVHDLVKRAPGEALRWALLASHYRQPLAWTDEGVTRARASLDRLYGTLQDSQRFLDDPVSLAIPDAPNYDVAAKESFDRFYNSLLDDLNTPQAFAQLFELSDMLREAMRPGSEPTVRYCRELLLRAGDLIGFLQADPEAWFQSGADEALKARIDGLIARRVAARGAKDWASADAIRAELTALGVEVMDNPTGATWRLKENA